MARNCRRYVQVVDKRGAGSDAMEGARRKKKPASCGQIRSPRMPSGHKARCQYARAVAKCGVGSNAIEGASCKKDLQAVDSPIMGEWRQARNVPPVRTGC